MYPVAVFMFETNYLLHLKLKKIEVGKLSVSVILLVDVF